MITTQDIYRAIRFRLETGFADKNIQVKDDKNPQRPCFYIEYNDVHDRVDADGVINTISQFNIIYFSETRTLLELTEIEKELRKILQKPLKITDIDGSFKKWLEIQNIEITADEDDYILDCDIDFDFLQDSEVDNPYDEYQNDELMNDLTVNCEKGEQI